MVCLHHTRLKPKGDRASHSAALSLWVWAPWTQWSKKQIKTHLFKLAFSSFFSSLWWLFWKVPYEHNFIYLLGLLWSNPLNDCIKEIFICYVLQTQTQNSLSSSVWLDKISREVNSAVGWGQALVQRCCWDAKERKVLIWRPLENEQQEEDCGGNTELTAGKCEVCHSSGHWEEKQEAEKETWQFKLEHNTE